MGRLAFHTWQSNWLLKVIEVKLGEDAKPVVVLQEDQFWLFVITSVSLE